MLTANILGQAPAQMTLQPLKATAKTPEAQCGPLPTVRGRKADPTDYVCVGGRWQRRAGREPAADVREEKSAQAQCKAAGVDLKHLATCVRLITEGPSVAECGAHGIHPFDCPDTLTIQQAKEWTQVRRSEERTKRIADLAATCQQSVPQQYVPACVELLQENVPLDEIIAEVNKLLDQAAATGQGADPSSLLSAMRDRGMSSTTKYLLIGAAALVVVGGSAALVIRHRRRKAAGLAGWGRRAGERRINSSIIRQRRAKRAAKHRAAKTTKGWAKASPDTKRDRARVWRRCGPSAFLLPNKRDPGASKFPIVATRGGCEVDCRGLRTAVSRADRYGYAGVERRARKIARGARCSWAA